MTFLELQNQLVQTKKARKGTSNRRDYYKSPNNDYEFDGAVYHKALFVANKVVQHYYDMKEINLKEKISLIFGDVKESREIKFDKNEKLRRKNQNLHNEVRELKKYIKEMRDKHTHGGRKGYDETMTAKVKMARDNGETWRGLSARLGISTTTAQKLYKEGKKL